jgi:hypothetical protein
LVHEWFASTRHFVSGNEATLTVVAVVIAFVSVGVLRHSAPLGAECRRFGD